MLDLQHGREFEPCRGMEIFLILILKLIKIKCPLCGFEPSTLVVRIHLKTEVRISEKFPSEQRFTLTYTVFSQKNANSKLPFFVTPNSIIYLIV